MSISVVFIIKNGIKQGYCFWESLLSCLPIASEIIISDGYSDDGTIDVLWQFKNTYNIPINLYQDKWEEKSYHGEVIAKVSERAIQKAIYDWIYYLQADEIIHEDNISFIKTIINKNYNSVMFPFYHFNKAWRPSTEGYKEAIRMIRNKRNIKLKGDGWTFEGDIDPICPSKMCPKPIYHFNWCFPKQNVVKYIEHYKIYQNVVEYKDKLKNIDKTTQIYPIDPTFNDFPMLARRFVGSDLYRLPFDL